jgi:hypothetical protein
MVKSRVLCFGLEDHAATVLYPIMPLKRKASRMLIHSAVAAHTLHTISLLCVRAALISSIKMKITKCSHLKATKLLLELSSPLTFKYVV